MRAMAQEASLGATANARFKERYPRYFAIAAGASVVAHILFMVLGPGMSPPSLETRLAEQMFVDIPPEIAIPPPPAQIAKPAVPVEASVEEEVSEEITIVETTPKVNIPVGPSVEEVPTFTPYEVAPTLIKGTVRLNYPELLKKAGIEGTVLLWLRIDPEGNIKKVRVFKSSGNAALDDSAVRAYQVARFTPAYSRDIPVAVWVQWPVQFKLK